MEYRYGDYIKCNTKFDENCYAIFLCYRPDKNTVVFDYEKRLHEIDINKTSSTTHKEMMNYFNKNINAYKQTVKKYTKLLNEIMERQRFLIIEKDKLNTRKNDLQEKYDSLTIARTLSEVECDDELEGQIFFQGEGLKNVKDEINFFHFQIKNTRQYQDNYNNSIENATREMEVWKNKKQAYLKGVKTNENR